MKFTKNQKKTEGPTKITLQKWQNFSDKQLIAEWEKLPHDGREDN